MATEAQLRERREAEDRARREARRSAAIEAGDWQWALLPETVKDAWRRGKEYAFSGKPCESGHVARRYAHNGRCTECVLPTAADVSPVEQTWAQRFALVADKIEATGRLHYLAGGGMCRVIETQRKVRVFDNLREASAKAARLTARDGELRCVVPGATRWVVKKRLNG
jgi:hypothetical protein